MKRILLSFLACLCVSIGALAQTEVTAATPLSAANVPSDVTVLHVTGTLSDADVTYISSLAGLKLLDLSEATATKEQAVKCVAIDNWGNLSPKADVELIIPTPQTSDYTTGMTDLYYYQNVFYAWQGVLNFAFYEMSEENGVLTRTNNLKVWGTVDGQSRTTSLANLTLAQSPQIINNTMGISFLPNYTEAGDLNWRIGDYGVYPTVPNNFVSNVLSQLNCASIDMMWLNHSSLKYDFSGLNPQTHYIVIPNNVAGYRTDSDIDDRVSGTDYNYGTYSDTEGVWVVGSYAGTAHPYSGGIAYDGEVVLTQSSSVDAEFGVTTNVTFIRQPGKLAGAAATLNQFQKNATRMIMIGQCDNSDLDAMQYVASTKVDLSKLALTEGSSITHFTNNSVQYLTLPGNASPEEFVPSSIKAKCASLLGVGLYKEVTDVVPTAGNPVPEEKDNKLYYASWQVGGVRTIMNMLPEAQTDGSSVNGVHSYKMWGPLNHADIANTDATNVGNDGNYSSTANEYSKNIAGLLGKSTKIYDADLSMAWFPNQDDMNFNIAAAYGANTFAACELPRTHMTTIPANAFNNMQALHYIGLPNIYTTIKENAFYEVGILPVGDGSLVGPLQIDTYEVEKVTDTYSYTADDALIKEVVTNGPLTVTLPESLGHSEGEGLYTGSMHFTPRVKDVYVMADPAPYCQIDAFGSVAYVGNNTYGGVTSHPFARDKYRMGVGTYTEETENQWICVLHFPASTVKNGENYNYTDPTREYCLYDETGEVDGNSMPVVWPNQSEMLRSYNQAVTGVTWNAWDRTRVENEQFGNYNEFVGAEGYGVYNTPTPQYNIDATLTYDKEHYCGWHQFILANTWLPIPDIDKHEEVNYVKLDWFTFCIPYNMIKTTKTLASIPHSTVDPTLPNLPSPPLPLPLCHPLLCSLYLSAYFCLACSVILFLVCFFIFHI